MAIVVETCDWRFAGAKAGCGGVSDQWRKIFENAADSGVSEAGVPQPQLKGFDRVRKRARIQTAQSIKLFHGYSRLKSHANPLHQLSIGLIVRGQSFCQIPSKRPKDYS
jgi:hypothetical protein